MFTPGLEKVPYNHHLEWSETKMSPGMTRPRSIPTPHGVVLALLLTSMIIAQWGCGDQNAAGVSSRYSIIKGTVTDDSGGYSFDRVAGFRTVSMAGSAVQGAKVVAMWAPSGGTLGPISDTAITDAAGGFSLTCGTTGINNVKVVATKDGRTWEAIVGSRLSLGGIAHCQPLTDQSTVEARVYSMLAGGSGSGSVALADIVEVVSSPVAAAAKNTDAGIEQLAASIKAGEETWILALQNSSIGNASLPTVNVVQLIRSTAEQALELGLNKAGENRALSENAFTVFLQEDQEAYLTEGVGTQAVAQIAAICSRAETNALTGADSTLKLEVTRQTNLITAFMVKDAIDSSMRALLASQLKLDSANAAGEALMEEIQGSYTSAEIGSALSTYHDTILRLTANAVGGEQASQVTAADSLINAVIGLKPNFLRVISLQLSAGDLVQIYASFFQGVESETKKVVSPLPAYEVNAIASILMLTNMTN